MKNTTQLILGEVKKMNTNSSYPGRQLRNLIRDVTRHLKDGMAKGFFELRIICEVVKGGKRKINVLYSPSERYTVPEEDLNE
jgi:hypothetical protein